MNDFILKHQISLFAAFLLFVLAGSYLLLLLTTSCNVNKSNQPHAKQYKLYNFRDKVYIQDKDTGLCYVMGSIANPDFSHAATAGMAQVPCHLIPVQPKITEKKQ